MASNCTCDEWRDNLPKINGPLSFLEVSRGWTYDGKPFVYCPWCGTKLTVRGPEPKP